MNWKEQMHITHDYEQENTLNVCGTKHVTVTKTHTSQMSELNATPSSSASLRDDARAPCLSHTQRSLELKDKSSRGPAFTRTSTLKLRLHQVHNTQYPIHEADGVTD